MRRDSFKIKKEITKIKPQTTTSMSLLISMSFGFKKKQKKNEMFFSLLLSKQDMEAKNAGEFYSSVVKYNKKLK